MPAVLSWVAVAWNKFAEAVSLCQVTCIAIYRITSRGTIIPKDDNGFSVKRMIMNQAFCWFCMKGLDREDISQLSV